MTSVIISLESNRDDFDLVIVQTSLIIQKENVFNLGYDKWGALCKQLQEQKLQTAYIHIHSSVGRDITHVVNKLISIAEKIKIKTIRLFIG